MFDKKWKRDALVFAVIIGIGAACLLLGRCTRDGEIKELETAVTTARNESESFRQRNSELEDANEILSSAIESFEKTFGEIVSNLEKSGSEIQSTIGRIQNVTVKLYEDNREAINMVEELQKRSMQREN